ncbi:hypothetical protein Bbelb_192040, partial [Branchiostoma belcheri]
MGRVFTGNTDSDTQVMNLLDSPVEARYVRFFPLTWNDEISMRVEILGCSTNTTLISGLRLDDAASGHLTVSWTVVGNHPISRYRLRYQPADGSGSYQDMCPAPEFGATSATVQGLLANTEYTLTLTSFDEDDQPNGVINGTFTTVCQVPLGMESGVIPDDNITASSIRGSPSVTDYKPYRARLNGVAGWGSWIADNNSIGEWLQVDLGEMKRVTGTSTQGRHWRNPNWVTSYKLLYSADGSSWTTYTDGDGSEMVFTGNTDQRTPVTNLLDNPVDARYVRFYPQSWNVRIAMRVEILGCRINNGFFGFCVDPPTQANTIGPVCDCPYLPGENCTYPCSPGYHVTSGDVITRTCTSNGSWTEPDLFCHPEASCSITKFGDGDHMPVTRDLPPVVSPPFIFEVKVNTSGAGVVIRLEVPGGGGYRIEIQSGRSKSQRVGSQRAGVARVDTPDMTSSEEFRRFWICWSKGGSFGVGRSGDVEPFMNWTDPQPFIADISRAGYATKNVPGELKFNCTQDGFPGVCVDPPLQANTTGPVCDCPYLLGENCTYPCSPGYHVTSGDVIARTCSADGSWTEPNLFCQPEDPSTTTPTKVTTAIATTSITTTTPATTSITTTTSATTSITTTTSATTFITTTTPATTTLMSTTSSTTAVRKTTRFVFGALDGESSDYLDDEVSTENMSPTTTIPTLPPSTPQPAAFIVTQAWSTQAPFLIEEEIPVLIQTLSEKVNHFSGSLGDRKELLQGMECPQECLPALFVDMPTFLETLGKTCLPRRPTFCVPGAQVTDATSSVLRVQSSTRETVAMETTFDLSSGVTDGLKKLVDVQSTDLSPMEQLIQEKKEQERLKARVIGQTRDLLKILDAAADRLLEESPPEGESTYFRSDGVLTSVKKGIPDVGVVPIGQDVGSVVFTKEDNLPEGSTMKVVAFVEDPFVWSVEKTEVSSSVVMVTITKDTDDVDGSQPDPLNITVIVKQKVQFGTTSDTEQQYHDTLPTSYRQNLAGAGSSSFPLSKVPKPGVTDMTYHAVYISDEGQVPLIRFSVDDVDSELQVYFRFHDFPTEEDYDYTTTVKPPEVTDYDGFDMPFGLVYSSFNGSIVPEIRKERGWLFVGVKKKGGDLSQTGLRRLLTSEVRATAPPADSAGFLLQTAAVSCLLREMDNHTWDSRRCKVGVQTNEDTTRCTCDMTRQGRSSRVVLATSFVAVPNFVDFSKFGSNIDKLSTNYTVFGTILALWMVFLMSQLLTLQINIKGHIAMSTAVADSVALGQAARLSQTHPGLGAVPSVSTIPSEVPGAEYVYVVCVRTGTQPDAGTASVVGLMVTGSDGRTPMVTLNPDGLVLARGGDTYHIMSTPSSIGQLQSVQVWHDGSGKGSMESLFIDNIKVWDTQASQGFYFPCNAWLSSCKGDGRTIRTTRAAPGGEMGMSEYTLRTFSYLLYDDHLLLSAVCNSGVRHFSRAQRMVCCLTQITLWMVGSAMWYGYKLGPSDVVLLDAGFVTFRLSEMIGIAATSFTVFLPVYAILVPMFRTQRPLVDQIPSGLYETPTSPSTWRFSFKTVAWILAILTSVSSSLFVIVYSLQFGAERSQAWLKDFVLAFMFSTFVLEPIQIFLIAYSKAVVIGPIVGTVTACVRGVFGKNLSGKKDRPPLGDIQRKSRGYDVPARRVLPPAPKKTDHDPNWTERMAQGRNILVLLVFLLIFTGNAFYIGVLGFDRHAYYVRTSLENSLLSGYEEVTTADGAWEWLSSDLMPSLHPERGYSGKTLRWLDKQFPAGTNAFRIGPVRLERTTKYPEDPIDIDLEHSGQKLYPELQMFLQNEAIGRHNGRNCSHNETTSIVNEVRNGTSVCFSTVDLPQDADQAAAVIDFLKKTHWILMVSDTLTLRINFYHPDVKLFSTVAITLQYLPGGAAEMQPTIQTFRLFQYETAHDFVQMIFHIVFVLVYIYNLFTEILNVQKSGRLYFVSFWNILILCNIGMSPAVIVTFALRYIQTAAALADIQQAKGLLGINEFVDISTASQWDAAFKEVLSFSIFISTFSILRVLNFSKSVATVFALPRLIYRAALGFSVYMLVVIVAYSFSGILIFGKNMESFSGFKKTSYVLFEMGLGRPFVGVFADDMKA